MKKKIAYIDHYFHLKTKSGDFLREIFKKNHKITNYWIHNDMTFNNDIFAYKNIFFFQILPPIKILKKLKNKNIIWAPMYDSPHYPLGFSWLLWKIVKFYKIKVLIFSKDLLVQAKKYNIDYKYFKYFKKPITSKKIKRSKKIKIFFWYRNDLKVQDWHPFLNTKIIKKVTCLNLSKDQSNYLQKFKNKTIFIKKKFLNKKKFISLLKNCDVFICPRKKEGIGMAQVEALSMGKYLVGYNDSTMNDYIFNSKIGYLLNNKMLPNNFYDLVIKNQQFRNDHAKKGYEMFKKNISLFKRFYTTNPNRYAYSFLVEKILELQYYFQVIKRKLYLLFFK